VFRLTPDGLELTEIAPGVDLERDILARMPFRPLVRSPKLMESAIFRPEPMGLRGRLLDIRFEERLQYDAGSNTIYIDLSAMRVRSQEDLRNIREAVDRILGPIGKRAYAVVNYERFECDVEMLAGYIDLVKYVQDTYYISVKRYTSSAFLRHKLGTELGERRSLPFQVFGSADEAGAGDRK
jgi:propionate CoA-transferase